MNLHDLKFKTTKTVETVITPSDVYGCAWQSRLPEGYEVIAFRHLEPKELYLRANSSNTLVVGYEAYGYYSAPRLIVQKIKPKFQRYVIEPNSFMDWTEPGLTFTTTAGHKIKVIRKIEE